MRQIIATPEAEAILTPTITEGEALSLSLLAGSNGLSWRIRNGIWQLPCQSYTFLINQATISGDPEGELFWWLYIQRSQWTHVIEDGTSASALMPYGLRYAKYIIDGGVVDINRSCVKWGAGCKL